MGIGNIGLISENEIIEKWCGVFTVVSVEKEDIRQWSKRLR
jgi:hypothetical protein